MNNKLEFTGIDGHLILYCKHHYTISDNIIEDLKKIWAIRCGYEYNNEDNSAIKNIADSLYKILSITIKNNIHFQELLHDHLLHRRYKNMKIHESIILFYVCEIANLQVREKIGNKWHNLIKLPKPKKRIFNRIIKGNGRFEDYKEIS